jgi:ATP-dependent Clp protease protease subunit
VNLLYHIILIFYWRNSAAPQPSLSCATKVFVGLRPQSSILAGNQKPPNLSAQFHEEVHKRVQTACKGTKPVRGRARMMPIGTPRVPYKTPGENTWQWVDLWNALYRERIIFLGQDIDEEYSNQVLGTLLYLDSIENSKKIWLFINSAGGDITPSLALYDTIKSLKNDIGTHCIGFAYNMPAFILAGGEKGNRTGMPLSRVALTAPAGAARGRADDIRTEANELLRIRDYLFNELAENTGQPVDKIYQDLKWLKRFNAQTAVEYGLIDRIVRPSRIKADAPKRGNTGLG